MFSVERGTGQDASLSREARNYITNGVLDLSERWGQK